MKTCKKCGATFEDNATFCSTCGGKLKSDDNSSGNFQSNNTMGQVFDNVKDKFQLQTMAINPKILIAIGVILVVVLGSFLYTTVFSNESGSVVSAIENGDYAKAIELYGEEIAGNRELEVAVERALEEKIEEYITEYNEGTLNEDEVEVLLSTITKCKIFTDSTVSDAYLLFNELAASKDVYAQAETQFEEGNYLNAVAQYEQVSDADENYKTAQEKITESYAVYKTDALTRIEQAIADNQFQTAFSLLEVACNALGGDDDLDNVYLACQTAYEAYTVGNAIEDANQLMSDNEYSRAYAVLVNASYEFDSNLDLATALSNCKVDYVGLTLQQADNAFCDGWDYETSIKLIQTAMSDLPDDAQLQAALEEYESYRPMWVGDLVAFQENGNFSAWCNTEIQDNLGQTYTNYFYGKPSSMTNSGWGSNTYLLNGAYNHISGRIIIDFDDRNIESFGGYAFVADGIELLNTGVLTGSTEPIDFTFDLTGVTELKIYSYARYSIGSWRQYTASLVDTYLTKDFPVEVA